MANLDTAGKRGSGMNPVGPWRSLWPLPDGAITQGDRQHTAFMYSGILASGPVAPSAGAGYGISVGVMSRMGEQGPTIGGVM